MKIEEIIVAFENCRNKYGNNIELDGYLRLTHKDIANVCHEAAVIKYNKQLTAKEEPPK